MRSYQVGERVQSGNAFFICTTAYAVDSASPMPPETDTGHWTVDGPNFSMLDAWGTPILFVPPLGAVNLTEGGATHGTGATAPKQAPDRKGYFMSAGPDHDFAAGDDNVYSFENK
jgi:hypothetical protein